MMRTRIKMCGTTRLEDARTATELGIDALGFIFVESSPRYITPESAASIIRTLPSFVGRVGVFVNKDVEAIKAIVTECGLTQLQLHGNESPAFCATLKQWHTSITICKAFRVGGDSPAVNTAPYSPSIHTILLDTYIKGVEGGTGSQFDWSLIDSIQLDRPLILAGGLSPKNITDALSVVSPFAVDVNSGIEDEPGVKNHRKLAELVSRVAEFDYQRK